MAQSSANYGTVITKVDNPLRKSGLAGNGRTPALGLGLDDSRTVRRRELMLDDNVLEYKALEARRFSPWRRAIYWLLSVITLGTVWIVANWPFMKLQVTRWLSLPSAHNDAEVVLITAMDGATEICPVEMVAAKQLALLSGSAARQQARPPLSIAKAQRMFIFRHVRFLFNPLSESFRQLDVEDYVRKVESVDGLTGAEAIARLAQCGQNVIDIPIPPTFTLLIRECVHPFVIFQIWAVIVWMTEAYYTFSMFILVAALATAVMNFWEVRKNLLDIQKLSKYTSSVRVVRERAVRTVCSSELVPGDLLLLEGETKMPCDCVIVRGQCTVNEAMLTGETTVVTKQAMEHPDYNLPETRNTLFGGSLVVQLRVPKGESVVAVVVRTGFESVKGRLVLSILYPRPTKFKFLEQSLMFVGVLFLLALVGFGLNAKALDTLGTPIDKIIQRGCDLITIVVPPALPLALTIGIAYAILALRKDKIFCISPPRVNLAGKINCFCFDKTGTLTTEGLELLCLRPSQRRAFEAEVRSTGDAPADMVMLLATCHSLTHVKGTLAGDPLELQTFNFSQSVLEEPHTHGITGDFVCRVSIPAPTTGRPRSHSQQQQQAPARATSFEVVRQFEFMPVLQRMSCLVRGSDGSVTAVVKGSPEAIHTLCTPASLPHDYFDVLGEYTHRGFRVIAAACKPYHGPIVTGTGPSSVTADGLRRACESDLHFMGFIVLENRLKVESAPTLSRLRKEAGISLHMITGDNAVAAVCVARDCGMVEAGYRVFIGDVGSPSPQPASELATGGGYGSPHKPAIRWVDVDDASKTLNDATLLPTDGSQAMPYRLAITGRAYTMLVDAVEAGTITPEYMARVVVNCVVCARMSPENKASLVERLQATGLYVGMCGDGANDSLALRAAHVGISLSQVEASVSAPFTSMVPNIACVPKVLCEGRGALATSFCLFQFMALYSTIQFANALLIVWSGSFLSNNEYMYQDLFIVFILALSMGSTPSSQVLTRKRPSANLLSAYNLTLCFGFVTCTFIMQGIVFLRVRRQSWYGTAEYPAEMNPDEDEEGTNSVIPETTTVFLLAMLQYVATAAIFSIGWPWKQATYRNYVFSSWLAVVVGVSLFLYVHPDSTLYEFIGLQILPMDWHLELFAWSCAAFALYFVFLAVAYAARRCGVFTTLTRLLCRRPVALHKVMRRGWAKQFRLRALGDTSSSCSGSGLTPTGNLKRGGARPDGVQPEQVVILSAEGNDGVVAW